MSDPHALALLLALAGCTTLPPAPPPPPPEGARRWDLAPSVAPERFVLRVPGLFRITFEALEPLAPIGLERGESFVGVGVDVSGIWLGPDVDEPQPAARPGTVDRDLERVEERRRRDDLDRSIDQVLEAAERAREPAPSP